jgi:hypothetical protein
MGHTWVRGAVLLLHVLVWIREVAHPPTGLERNRETASTPVIWSVVSSLVVLGLVAHRVGGPLLKLLLLSPRHREAVVLLYRLERAVAPPKVVARPPLDLLLLLRVATSYKRLLLLLLLLLHRLHVGVVVKAWV